MYGIIYAIAAFFQAFQLSLPQAQMQRPPKPDDVIATVNGQTITASEVEKLLWDWAGYPYTQQVIGMVMIEEAAKAAGVSITDEEIREEVEKRVAQYRANIPEGRTFEQHLRAMGQPYSFVWVQARQEMLVDKIAIKDFDPSALRKISHIVIKPRDFSELARGEAKIKAKEVIAWAKGGESWGTLVDKYSEDMATKPLNGNLGWVSPQDLTQAMRDAVKNGKSGDVIGPFESAMGIVVILVENAGPPPANELEAAKNIFLQRSRDRLQQKLRDEYKYENKLMPPIKGNGG
jgi:foldase protein PrsA